MTSTGNDIVSLAHINVQRSRHKQFYDKILSQSELELYKKEVAAEMPMELFVWLAWSIKESAYKYLQRHIPDLLFSPRKINIHSIQLPANYSVNEFGYLPYETTSFPEEITCHCTVRNGNVVLHSRSIVHHQFIYSVVNNEASFADVWWGIKAIEDSALKQQSEQVRSFLLNKLRAVLPARSLNIDKSPHGYPVMVNASKETDVPVSFTHHHHFIAYSFLLSAVSSASL